MRSPLDIIPQGLRGDRATLVVLPPTFCTCILNQEDQQYQRLKTVRLGSELCEVSLAGILHGMARYLWGFVFFLLWAGTRWCATFRGAGEPGSLLVLSPRTSDARNMICPFLPETEYEFSFVTKQPLISIDTLVPYTLFVVLHCYRTRCIYWHEPHDWFRNLFISALLGINGPIFLSNICSVWFVSPTGIDLTLFNECVANFVV